MNDPSTNVNFIAFENYFQNYSHYDQGGEIDRAIITEAKTIYEKYKSSVRLKNLLDSLHSMTQDEPISDNFAKTYQSVLCALNYSLYCDKFAYLTNELLKYQQNENPQHKSHSFFGWMFKRAS